MTKRLIEDRLDDLTVDETLWPGAKETISEAATELRQMREAMHSVLPLLRELHTLAAAVHRLTEEVRLSGGL